MEVRKIAAEKNVPLVDLQARSIELCESLGPEKCHEFSPIKTVDGNESLRRHAPQTQRQRDVRAAGRGGASQKRAGTGSRFAGRTARESVITRHHYNAVVYEDGSGTQTNLQAAINAAPDNGTNPYTILIEPGTYTGPVHRAEGETATSNWSAKDADNTILTYPFNVHEPPPGETYPFNPGVAVAGDDFSAENLTFQNTSGDHGQALALRADGDRETLQPLPHPRLAGHVDGQ